LELLPLLPELDPLDEVPLFEEDEVPPPLDEWFDSEHPLFG